MCIDQLTRGCCPCMRNDDPDPTESGSEPRCPLTRIALSVASVAIGVFTTILSIATGDVIALGLTVALGIAAICLWPKQHGARAYPPPLPFPHVHHAFETTFPIIPPPMAIPTPVFSSPPFITLSPFPSVVSYGPPDTRVRVGGGGTTRPAAPPPMQAYQPAGEARVTVGGRGRPYGQPPPPAFQPLHTPTTTTHWSPSAGEERVTVGSHGRAMPVPSIPVVNYPTFSTTTTTSTAGEARVQVGGAQRQPTGFPPSHTSPPSHSEDERRVPVGKKY